MNLMMMKSGGGRYRGFSLVEVILCLMIVAMLSAFAALGILHMTQGFVASKQNLTVSRNAQFAFSRILKELRSHSGITSGSATSIEFLSRDPQKTIRIFRQNDTIQISEDGLAAVLVDNLSAGPDSFRIDYMDTYGEAVPSASLLTTTRMVRIRATFDGATGVATPFFAVVRRDGP